MPVSDGHYNYSAASFNTAQEASGVTFREIDALGVTYKTNSRASRF